MIDFTDEYQRILPAVTAVVQDVADYVAGRHQRHAAATTDVASLIALFEAIDRPATDMLRQRLVQVRPDAAWAQDEVDTAVTDRGELWVCDAADGAVQYLQGLPYWGVSVTLVADGQPALAVLKAPELGFSFTAVRGHGARLNGRPITPSGKLLPAALACTSQPPFNTEPERAGVSLTAMLRRTLAVRNLGPTALQVSQVGSGHVDLFWEFGTDANNLLPGALIAAEAGAVVTDAQGAPWTAGSSSFLAAAPSLHAQALEVLASI